MPCLRLLEDGSFRLLEDGTSFRLLEQCDEPTPENEDIYAVLHDDELVFPLLVGSKLRAKEVVCAPERGTHRRPGKAFPLEVDCCDRKKP